MTFTYRWKLSDLATIPKKSIKVFSTFACGGGSSMGYKMAGLDVIGCLEIDPKINAIYQKNLGPRLNYCEDIRAFNKRKDLPQELFELDILDGSPPCSSFSMVGNREKDWGKEKVFAEGQQLQTLDDLFFHYLDTVNLLRPKIFIAENVKGLIQGNAKGYALKIAEKIKAIGYDFQLFQLNAANMGIPQKRERIFFIGHKKELNFPKLKIEFKERPILFGEMTNNEKGKRISKKQEEIWNKTKEINNPCFGTASSELYKKRAAYSYRTIFKNQIPSTLTSENRSVHYAFPNLLSLKDLTLIQSFPSDYQFLSEFILGMSVPPLMIYKIVKEIEKQWPINPIVDPIRITSHN